MAQEKKTLDELMAEYEPERQAEIAKDFTPEAIARRDAKAKEQIEREIRQGLRDANGDWIDQPELDEEEPEEDEESDGEEDDD